MTLRHRTRGSFTPVTTASLWRYTGVGAPWVQSPGYSLPLNVGTVEDMYDGVTTRFRERQKAGEKFFNNMSYTRTAYEHSSGNGYQLHDANNGERIDGDALHAWLPHSGTNITVGIFNALADDDISRACAEVSTRVLSDRGRSATNLWESLAEADKAVALLRPSLSRFTRLCNEALKAKKEGRFKGHAASGVSNLYLAYRYGFRPIISDVEGIIAGLKKGRGTKEVTTRSRIQLNAVKVNTGSSIAGVVKVDYSNVIQDFVVVRGMSLDEVMLTALNNVGFSAKGLLTLPWELTPYSFVADWAFNVGDFIGAITPAFGWKALGSCLSVQRTVTNSYSAANTSLTSAAYTLDRPVSGSVLCTRVTKSRGPLTPPSLVIKSDFRFDKFTRVADAWAIAGQLFLRTFGGTRFSVSPHQRYTE